MIKVTFMDAYTFRTLREMECMEVTDSIVPTTHITLGGVGGDDSCNMMIPVEGLVVKTQEIYEEESITPPPTTESVKRG